MFRYIWLSKYQVHWFSLKLATNVISSDVLTCIYALLLVISQCDWRNRNDTDHSTNVIRPTRLLGQDPQNTERQIHVFSFVGRLNYFFLVKPAGDDVWRKPYKPSTWISFTGSKKRGVQPHSLESGAMAFGIIGIIIEIILFAVPFGLAHGPFSRHACQSPTPNPLAGCPPGTILVAQNGSLPHTISSANVFRSIQSAVQSLVNTTLPSTILILPGNYREQVNITTNAPLTILGQTPLPNSRTNNTVRVSFALATGNKVNKFDNVYTATLIVAPSLQAALTGSGPTGYNVSTDQSFGSSDFRVYNVDFINDWAEFADGPALALAVGYVNAGFYLCRWYSYQDTVSYHKPGFHLELSSIKDKSEDFTTLIKSLQLTRY